MSLWVWTFLVLLVTAVFGLWLFAGFTFRVRPRYPFALVTSHVIGATASLVLFCILVVRWFAHHQAVHSYAPVVLIIALVVLLATFLSGLYFYFGFNVRRRHLTYKLLITHLAMAALAFIFAIAGIAEASGPVHTQKFYPSSMYNFHKHHRSQ